MQLLKEIGIIDHFCIVRHQKWLSDHKMHQCSPRREQFWLRVQVSCARPNYAMFECWCFHEFFPRSTFWSEKPFWLFGRKSLCVLWKLLLLWLTLATFWRGKCANCLKCVRLFVELTVVNIQRSTVSWSHLEVLQNCASMMMLQWVVAQRNITTHKIG